MHPMLIRKILRDSQIFSFFDEQEIQSLADHMFVNLMRVEKADVVIRTQESGEQIGRMYLLLEGAVKVALPSAGGEHDVVLNVLTEGAIFGELAMLDGTPRSANVIALTDSTVASIHRSDFFQLAQKHPAMLEKIIKFLCAEVRRLSLRFEQVSSLNVRQRLAAYLLALSKTFKGQPIRMTQQELSGAVGATREQTSRIMSQFYKDGYLKKLDADLALRNDSVNQEHAGKLSRIGGKHAQITITAAGEKMLQSIVSVS